MTLFQRWILRITLGLSAVFVAGVIAQDFLDDESLFAAEESTMDDAVTGSLPEAETGNEDDMFDSLFGGGEGLDALESGGDTAVLDDAVMEDDLGDLTGAAAALENDEAFGTVDAETTTPDLFDELAPADAVEETDVPEASGGGDWNADSLLDEMLTTGDQDAAVAETMEEAGLGDVFEGELDAGGLEPETTADAGGDDFDALFGEMSTDDTAEEMPEKGSAEADDAGGDDLDSLFGDLAGDDTAAPEPEVAAADPVADAGGDDLDSLFGDLAGDDTAAPEPEVAAADPVADAGGDDLDSLFGDLAGDDTAAPEPEVAAADPVADAGGDDLDSLFGNLAGDDTAAPEPEAAADPVADAGGDDLDSLFGDLTGDDTAAPEPEAAADPVADAGGDDLDSLFGDLAGDDTAAPEPEAAADPVADAGGDDLDSLFGDLAGDDTAAPEPEVAAADPVADAGGDDLDSLFGDLAGDDTAAPEPEVAAVDPTEDADEDLEALFGEMAEPDPTVEPTAPSTGTAGDDKPVYRDELALNDDIFSNLAAEASEEAPPPAAMVPTAPRTTDRTPRTPNRPPPTPVEPSSDQMPPASPPSEPMNVSRAPRRAADAPEGTAAFEESERLLRIAREDHALNNLDAAEAALEVEDYRLAIQRFEESMRVLPKRADLEPAWARARAGLAEAYYQQARLLLQMKDLEGALASAESAVRNRHRKAPALVARLKDYLEKPEQLEDPPEVIRRWEEEDFQQIDREIEEWLRRGREAYLTGEYEKAILAFESVLSRDPENKEAIRMMRAAASRQYDRSTMELDSTRARMVATVRDTWNPRQYGLHEEPIETDKGMITGVREDEKQRQAIIEKMNAIRIPEVNFRQANIRDVLTFLQQQSVEFDPAENRAQRTGVNIILQLEPGKGEGAEDAGGAANAQPDLFGLPPAGGNAGGGSPDDTLVTFSALDITLKEALDIVVDVANLKYRIKGNVVMVVPADSADGEIIHRMYDVLPSAIARLQDLSSAVTSGGGNQQRGTGDFLSLQGQGDLGGGADIDLRSFFEEMGVAWPARASIKFVRGLGKLVVANTQENLAVFEKVLSILNVVPYQIEIEARFVEVAQTDVDSLGLEWMLTDNWEIAEMAEDANLPLNSRRRIVMNANDNSGGFTGGNRFLTDAGNGSMGILGESMMDGVATVSSVLTNPELSMVLHALQQKGNTDLLSAPKITTQSGQQATIKVVTEYIYPTAFETSGISGGETTTTTGTTGGGTVGAVVTPLDFETREVGVILEVLPEVSPEGQMINLLLSPEVVSEPTWRNYGSTYTSYDPEGNPVEQQLNMEQPFFHTRQLRTNLLIYNGATVVMGGMITEVRNTVDDKVPLLGDIPVFGRLFRSKYDASEKRNLLIFVTARLVDPSGRPLSRERMGLDNSIAGKIIGAE